MAQRQIEPSIKIFNETQHKKQTVSHPTNHQQLKKQNDQINDKNSEQDQFHSKTVKVNELKVDEEDLSDQEIEKFEQELPDKANQYKNSGNQLFKNGKCTEAIMEYQRGLKYTNNKNIRATLFSNMAICFIKLQDYNFAKRYCKKVLKQDQNHRKGRMNLARCFQEEKKLEEAFEQYKKLQQNLEGAPQRDTKYIKDKISQLKPKIDEINESRKKQVVDGLKNIGNSILGYFGMSLDNFKLQQGANGGYNISFKQ